MKDHYSGTADRWIVAGSLLLLLAAGLYAMFWPQGDFSEAERRYLAPAPVRVSLTEWSLDRETESWLSDRLPFRQALIAADACVQAATGRRTLLGAWPVAGAFLEPPVEGETETVLRRLGQFSALAEKMEVPFRVIVPRTHGSLLKNQMNALLRSQYDQEDRLYDALKTDDAFLEVFPEGTAAETVYYRTDHHWTLRGARMAYEAVCRADGLPVYSPEEYRCTRYEGFFGTTRSRSGLPCLTGDTLECAEPATGIRFTPGEGERVYDHLIFPERAETWDGYAVYLDGNHGMLEIRNPGAAGGTLLVFRDSFASCLLPLLAADYSRIVAVDARYYTGTFSQAAEAAGKADSLLFVYSLDSLVNDTSVAGKAGR